MENLVHRASFDSKDKDAPSKPRIKHVARSGLIDPEDEGCSEGDSRQEGVSTSVVSGVDASPVFEACEHVLDPVTLPVSDRIIAVLNTMLGMGWDAWPDTALDERLAEGR